MLSALLLAVCGSDSHVRGFETKRLATLFFYLIVCVAIHALLKANSGNIGFTYEKMTGIFGRLRWRM